MLKDLKSAGDDLAAAGYTGLQTALKTTMQERMQKFTNKYEKILKSLASKVSNDTTKQALTKAATDLGVINQELRTSGLTSALYTKVKVIK